MENPNNITDGTSYATATFAGGTLVFEPLYPSDSVFSCGQNWIGGADSNNTTITCVYPNSNPLYLAADSASEGAYIGANPNQSDTSNWCIGADGLMQLVLSDGTLSGLYADVSEETGIFNLTSTPSQKWKFTKSKSKSGGGR